MAESFHVCPHPKKSGRNLVHCDDPEHGPRRKCNVPGRKISLKISRSLYSDDAPSSLRAACSVCLTRRYRNLKKDSTQESFSILKMRKPFENLSYRQRKRRFATIVNESGMSRQEILDSVLSSLLKDKSSNLSLPDETKKN